LEIQRSTIESIVRKAVGQIATAAEWIARDHEREKVSLDHVLFFLNGLVKVDASAMEGLIEKRTICNEAMADHPTVQVQVPEQGPGFLLGFLGVLNGMFGAFAEGPKKGWGQIAAVFEQDGRLSGFRRTLDPQVRCTHCAGSEQECRRISTCNYTPKECAVCEGRGHLQELPDDTTSQAGQ
jgi:hypothetical protein